MEILKYRQAKLFEDGIGNFTKDPKRTLSKLCHTSRRSIIARKDGVILSSCEKQY